MDLSWLTAAATVIGIAVIATGGLVAGLNLTHGIAAWIRLAREPKPMRSLPARHWQDIEPLLPRLAILVPAFNEENTVVDTVRAMLGVEYPGLEVVIVNDGSRDATVERAVAAFGLKEVPVPPVPTRKVPLHHQPVQRLFKGQRVSLIDKVNGGKADALNAGIGLADADCICVVDADTLPERGAMLAAVRAFVDEPGQVLAVGGAIRIGNGLSLDQGHIADTRPPGNLLALLQTVEYLRTFHAARTAMGSFGAVGLISGAFGVFSRRALLQIGGYDRRTVGEDFELVLRLHRLAARMGLRQAVRYCPDAVAWTEAPQSLAVLSRQRRRWQRGALETLSRHSGMIGRGRYGAVGLIALPEALLVDVVAPISTVLGYLILPLAVLAGILSLDWLLAFVMLTTGIGLLNSAIGLAIEDLRFRRFAALKDWAVLMGASVLEVCGYRQLCDWWRVRGMWEYLRGVHSWGAMPRTGFQDRRAPSARAALSEPAPGPAGASVNSITDPDQRPVETCA